MKVAVLGHGTVGSGVAEILIEKHRSGSTGMVKLYFKGECTKFLNLNEDMGEPDEQAGEKSAPVKVSAEYEDLPETLPKEEQQPAVLKSIDDEVF